jgi:hypothetical protein
VDPDLLKRLYQECDGYAQRVHEKLVEDERIQIQRLFEKFQARTSRFSMSRVAAISIMVSEVCTRYS